ncbi:retrovirus-related pol polyprotein from transposon TNT 1-94 [Tanacetum coccineum]
MIAQGYTQEEGIDYDKVFAPVARIETIRLFLAYASFKDFVVYQMDVKSAFLYGKIKKEVYVCQPPGFENPNFPDRVYKVKKALFGQHQAPRAWFTEFKNASTLMETQKPLLKDEDGEEVDVHIYRSMIGSLIYLTSSRPDIMFAVCACARYQVNPKVSHLYAVKRIFRNLKGQPKLGLWFTEFKNASKLMETQKPLLKDEDGEEVDVHMYRSMIGSLMYLTSSRPDIMFIKGQPKFGFWYLKDSLFNLVAYTDSDYDGASLDRKSTIGEIVKDEAVYKVLGNNLVRATTTASSLEAEQDRGNITKTRSKATPNKAGSQGTTSGGGPRRQEPWGIQLLKLEEVKKLKQKKRSRTHGLKRLHKVGMSRRVESSGDEGDLDDADNKIFDVDALTGDEVFSKQEVVAKDVNLTVDEVTLAQALAALKSVKPKVKGDVIKEPSVPVSATSATTTTATILTPWKGIVSTELGTPIITRSSQQPSQEEVQDKGKGKMIEHKPVKPKKKDVQIMLDEEAAKKLQAEFDEEERLAREKDEANIALTEEWDDIQAKVDASYQLAERLQAKEQEQFTIKEKAILFKELLEQRRKHFVAKRAEEKRNKPPTKTQQKKTMITYLKNMEDKEEVAIDVVPLATKEDLEDLYKLVKARYGSTRPVEDLDLVLWNDLKTMFEPHVEDEIWKLQQRKKISPYTTYNYEYAEQEASS